MDISEIEADITNIENDLLIYDERNFERRANAIDFIDFHILDRIESMRQNAVDSKPLDQLEQHARMLRQQLDDIDANLFKQLRQNICTGVPFINVVSKYIHLDNIGDEQPGKPGYDNLDNFINGLLCCDALPEATITRDAEMVFYQQTPARIIFQLADMMHLKPGDVFFDIGSGLGQVGMLMNLLTGAKTVGVEYEPAYCNYAKKSAAQLNLTDVQFVNADARKADYSDGTVFFMYTPFEGDILRQVLDLLRREAEKRSVRLFTYGPCSPHIARQGWLSCVNGDGSGIYRLYEFRN
jgi:hypothetical protein